MMRVFQTPKVSLKPTALRYLMASCCPRACQIPMPSQCLMMSLRTRVCCYQMVYRCRTP